MRWCLPVATLCLLAVFATAAPSPGNIETRGGYGDISRKPDDLPTHLDHSKRKKHESDVAKVSIAGTLAAGKRMDRRTEEIAEIEITEREDEKTVRKHRPSERGEQKRSRRPEWLPLRRARPMESTDRNGKTDGAGEKTGKIDREIVEKKLDQRFNKREMKREERREEKQEEKREQVEMKEARRYERFQERKKQKLDRLDDMKERRRAEKENRRESRKKAREEKQKLIDEKHRKRADEKERADKKEEHGIAESLGGKVSENPPVVKPRKTIPGKEDMGKKSHGDKKKYGDHDGHDNGKRKHNHNHDKKKHEIPDLKKNEMEQDERDHHKKERDRDGEKSGEQEHDKRDHMKSGHTKHHHDKKEHVKHEDNTQEQAKHEHKKQRGNKQDRVVKKFDEHIHEKKIRERQHQDQLADKHHDRKEKPGKKSHHHKQNGQAGTRDEPIKIRKLFAPQPRPDVREPKPEFESRKVLEPLPSLEVKEIEAKQYVTPPGDIKFEKPSFPHSRPDEREPEPEDITHKKKITHSKKETHAIKSWTPNQKSLVDIEVRSLVKTDSKTGSHQKQKLSGKRNIA